MSGVNGAIVYFMYMRIIHIVCMSGTYLLNLFKTHPRHRHNGDKNIGNDHQYSVYNTTHKAQMK